MKGKRKKKVINSRKVDHLAPTNIENYHQSISAPAQREDLSHEEFKNKANVYSRAMNKPERFFSIQKLKEKHLNEAKQLNDNREKQDVNYDLGNRTYGQRKDHSILKDDRDWHDQNKRNEAVTKLKEEYDKDGLKKAYVSKHGKLGKSHEFNHAHNRHRNKGMDMDK